MKKSKLFPRNLRTGVVAGALAIVAASAPQVLAGSHSAHLFDGEDGDGISRVLMISIDGMHAVDLINCVNGVPGANGGAPYCPNLAALQTTGVTYPDTSTSKPSDSFPGLMAIVTGASPRTMGVNYDAAYDRALNPPKVTTGNGLAGGPCTTGATPSGTGTEYEEGIDLDQSHLNGGAPSGDGGINSINPDYLVRDKNCNPVYPWNFVRVNSVYGVIHSAGGYTAWADKHPAYSSIGGPTGTTSDTNVDDYFGPEINSNSMNYETDAFPALIPPGCSPNLPDTSPVAAGDDYTVSFQNIQCYDGIKVNAILNEIDGKNHDGTAHSKVPTIFGMNFQAVSIGQKLIYPYSTLGAGYSVKGGYKDPTLYTFGTPSDSLLKEIQFVDTSIGMMVSELKKQNLLGSTLIIITAKHGQSPVDSSRYKKNGSPNDPASILSACLFPSETGAQLGPTEDDVALLWLDQTVKGCDTASAVAALESASPVSNNIAGLGEIFAGPSLGLYYNAGDSRAPDILVTPNYGVTYSNSKKKLAEHGGFGHDDTNVIMLLSNPSLKAKTITSPVETAQIAPTILKALGLDPSALQAVRMEHTQSLPGLHLGEGD